MPSDLPELTQAVQRLAEHLQAHFVAGAASGVITPLAFGELAMLVSAAERLLPQEPADNSCRVGAAVREADTLERIRWAVGQVKAAYKLDRLREEGDSIEWPAGPCPEIDQAVIDALRWAADKLTPPKEPADDAGQNPQSALGGFAPPMSDRERDVYNVIRDKGPVTAKQIENELGAEPKSLERPIRQLKKYHGVKNRRGVGYYLDPTNDAGLTPD